MQEAAQRPPKERVLNVDEHGLERLDDRIRTPVRERPEPRNYGHAAEPGPRHRVSFEEYRQNPGVAGRRSEPRGGGGGEREEEIDPPWRKPGATPPRERVLNVDEHGVERLDDRIRTPEREPGGSAEAPHPGLERILCKHDDEHFRRRLPQLLPSDWRDLSQRQLKRHVGKWRKSQHRWRFSEEGGFRSWVLSRMPEPKWKALPEGQQRDHWQSFYYGDKEPMEAKGSESPERIRATGILRSRPRSREASASPKRRAGSNHRRIRGLSPSEDL